MSVERAPTPRDFPVLFTRKEALQFGGTKRNWPTCRVCGLVVEPRNRRRHEVACTRRRRLDRPMWERWRKDMHS